MKNKNVPGGLAATLRGQIRCTGIFHLPLLHDFQTHRRTGQQQFPAPPGVFDMDGFHRAAHIYMGNKTVGAVKKNVSVSPARQGRIPAGNDKAAIA